SNDNGKKSKAVPLHIVWNSAQDRMLIVGEGKLPAKAGVAFAHTRVHYVDRNEEGAGRKVSAALSQIAGTGNEKMDERLKTAFLMRNMLDSLPEQEKASLGDLLVRRDVKCFLPHYIVKPSKSALG
ncbi:MAG: hypothetical protein KJ667_00750, partial [Alphaproteobacteria bacterium]|nr:hypothetical protein [Alphaproteobacteria bacterium]